MKVFRFDGPLMRFFDRLGCLLFINIAFLVFSLPIVTVGVSLTAMYRCMLAMAFGDSTNMLKLFFSAFTSNFKKSLLLSMCVLPFLALGIYDALIFFSGNISMHWSNAIMSFFPLVLVYSIASYIFPLQAQYENSVLRTLKNALYLALSNIPATILMVIINLVFPLLVLSTPKLLLHAIPYWALFGFSFPVYLSSLLLKKIFKHYTPEIADE